MPVNQTKSINIAIIIIIINLLTHGY